MEERVRMRPSAEGIHRIGGRIAHYSQQQSRMLGTGDHGVILYRLEQFDTRRYGKLKVISMQELEYSIS